MPFRIEPSLLALFPRCVQRGRRGPGGATTSAGVNLPVSNLHPSSSLLPELVELVPPAVVFDKRYYSPFAEPHFHPFLQDRHIDAVVVTGGETDVCVLAMVLDAVDLGYRVIVASDALCSVSD